MNNYFTTEYTPTENDTNYFLKKNRKGQTAYPVYKKHILDWMKYDATFNFPFKILNVSVRKELSYDNKHKECYSAIHIIAQTKDGDKIYDEVFSSGDYTYYEEFDRQSLVTETKDIINDFLCKESRKAV